MNEDEFMKAFIKRREAQRPIENRRIMMGVMETAVDKAVRAFGVRVALKLLQEQWAIPKIASVTELSVEEITLLSQGKDLDADSDD